MHAMRPPEEPVTPDEQITLTFRSMLWFLSRNSRSEGQIETMRKHCVAALRTHVEAVDKRAATALAERQAAERRRNLHRRPR